MCWFEVHNKVNIQTRRSQQSSFSVTCSLLLKSTQTDKPALTWGLVEGSWMNLIYLPTLMPWCEFHTCRFKHWISPWLTLSYKFSHLIEKCHTYSSEEVAGIQWNRLMLHVLKWILKIETLEQFVDLCQVSWVTCK